MSRNLFITKPVRMPGETDAGEAPLRRTLGARELTLLGVGGVIGAGIFVITGQAAAEHAGPAIVLSFLIAGAACAFAALSYAEFAAMIPVSGSAYAYAYATMGESIAWFIGWSLVLEYLFAGATVAVGWSGYTVGLLHTLGVEFPPMLSGAPFTYIDGHFALTGALFNLPALLIVAAIASVAYVGIRTSAITNSIIVIIKVSVILLFVAFAARHIDTGNWHPFVPPYQGGDHFGWPGVFRAAAVIFLAYIGFDAISTVAQETRNPQRDMPIGILASLAVCTVLYIVVSGVLTGIMHYTGLGTAQPVATALEAYPDLLWLKTLVQMGAIAGLTSVILVILVAQPRIFYAMAGDGLLPPMFARVHPRHRTPHLSTALVGVLAALLGALFPLKVLGDLVSMGTLLAFATVSLGVLVLRRTRPDLPRPFRVPAAGIVCPLGALSCLGLLSTMGWYNWTLLAAWTALGFLLYFTYGYHHSKLRLAS